jgi:uncharacterized membrane protein YebE (DUF533 family)
MGYWKMLAGAAIGVGAIAAAPFTGGGSVLGAASLLGSLSGAGALAAGAGVAGAAAGAALAKKDKQKYDYARKEGYEEAKAEFALQMVELEAKLTEMMTDIANREQFIVTAFALGICCAYADGKICNTELDELDSLVAGIGSSQMLSETTKKQIIEMHMTPPNLSTVWGMIQRHNFVTEQHLTMFSTVVEIVVHADNMETPEEREFIERWYNLSAHAA